MLKNCPECNNIVSDKAYACPHCGFPFEKNISKSPRRSSKRRRLPNGFGQITELKGRNLARPFRAMITVGFTNEGRPIQKLLKPHAYFETYNDAYEALLKYNKNPYSFDSSMTLEQLYEKWYPEYIKTIDPKTTLYIRPAWNRFKPLWNIKLNDLRRFHIKELLTETQTSPTNINYMKRLINLMLDYAVEYEIIEKNIARDIDMASALINKENIHKTTHKDFNFDELGVLLSAKDNFIFSKLILIQCFMGWRPNELLNIKKSDLNIKEWYIEAGMKTESGKNRKVPVHSAIRDLVMYFYNINTNSPMLFNYYIAGEYRPISYVAYKNNFLKTLAKLNINIDHKLHDPRVTFITLCKKYNVDEYAIKYMAGHAIKDITEEVYTRRTMEWLHQEIEKIKIK